MKGAWLVLAALALAGAATYILLRDRPAADDEASPRAAAQQGTGWVDGIVRRGGSPVVARVSLTRILNASDVPPAFTAASQAAWLRRSAACARPIEPLASAESAADGRYQFDGLASGFYRVSTIAADGAEGFAFADLPVEGARAAADLVLPNGRETLRGRILDREGRPLRGWVAVEAAAKWTPGEWWVTAGLGPSNRLDAEGGFVSNFHDPGAVVVHIYPDAELFMWTSRPIPLPRADPWIKSVGKEDRDVEGRVVSDDSGSPVAGITVWASGQTEDGEAELRATTTDAEGRFRTRLPHDGTLGARGLGFAWNSVSPRGEGLAEIRLPRGTRVSGRVTSAAGGHPVPGLTVVAVPVEPFGSWVSEPVRTDDEGRYAIAGIARDEEVMIFATGGGWTTPLLASTRRGGYNPLAVDARRVKEARLDLTVERGVSVGGVVLDDSDRPVAGAVVRALVRGIGLASFGMSYAPVDPIGACVATARDGTFEIEGLLAGADYVLLADAPGLSQARAHVTPLAGRPTTDAVIRLSTGRWIDVTVVEDEPRRPLAGARVEWWTDDSSNGFRYGSAAATDTNGRLRIGPVANAILHVSANLEGYSSLHSVYVSAHQTSATVKMKVETDIQGSVRMLDGAPAENAIVRVGRWRGRAGRDGAFRVDRRMAWPDKMASATSAPGGPPLEATALVVDGRADLVLAAREASAFGGSLRVRVLDADGRPVPRAHAALAFPLGEPEKADVEDGSVVLWRSRPGAPTLEVWGPTAMDGTPLPLGPARLGPVERSIGEIEIRLPLEHAIEGHVRGPEGQGVEGAFVSLEMPDRKVAEWIHLPDWKDTRTDADGRFRLGGLRDSPYVLEVHPPPEFALPRLIDVRGGATGLVIHLRPGVRPRIQVLDTRGRPVPGARVSFGSTDDGLWGHTLAEAETGAAGEAVLDGLEAGMKGQLSVDPPPHRSDLYSDAPSDWSPSDTVVRLQLVRPIRGVIRDPSGAPVSGALVKAPPDVVPVRSAEDGTFLLDTVDAEAVDLRFDLEGRSAQLANIFHLDVGVESVDLTLERGAELLLHVEDAQRDSGGAMRVVVWSQSTKKEEAFHLERSLPPDGTARIAGLQASGLYDVWVGRDNRSMSALRTGIRGDSQEVRIQLEPGKSISGRIMAPPRTRSLNVVAYFGHRSLRVEGTVEPDGTYEIRGLTGGSWQVRAYGLVEDDMMQGSTAAEAGATADVTLKPR